MNMLRTLFALTCILVTLFLFGCESVESITTEKEDTVVVKVKAWAEIWPPASGKGQVVRFDFNKNGGEPFMVERTNDQLIKKPPQYAEVSYNLHSGEQINIKVSIPNTSGSDYLKSNTAHDYLVYDNAKEKAVPTKDKHVFSYTWKVEYLLTLDPIESETSSTSPSVITSQKPPIFSKADMVIAGLPNMTLDDTQSRVYENEQLYKGSIKTHNGLDCLYVRRPDTQNVCSARLQIIYYFDVAYADEIQAGLEAELYLTTNDLEFLRASPNSYKIIEADLGSGRKTLLWSIIPSSGQSTFYNGRRLIRFDEHYFISVWASGTGFNSPEELKLVADKFEQHGLAIVNQKKAQR